MMGGGARAVLVPCDRQADDGWRITPRVLELKDLVLVPRDRQADDATGWNQRIHCL